MDDKPMRSVKDRAGPLGAVVKVVLRSLGTRVRETLNTQGFVVVAEVAAEGIVSANQQTARHSLVEPDVACLVFGLRRRFKSRTRSPRRIHAPKLHARRRGRTSRRDHGVRLLPSENRRIRLSLPNLMIRPISGVAELEN